MYKFDFLIIVLFILIVLLLSLFFQLSDSRGEQIQLKWEYNGMQPDGFYIYQRISGNAWPAEPSVTIQNPNARAVIVDPPGEAGRAIRYDWIARTFLGDQISEPSNFVEYTVVRVPPPEPADLAGSFDADESVIRISWQQPEDEYSGQYPATHWRVYYTLGDVEFTELGLVRGGNLELTTGFSAVPAGQRESVSFVVVAYRRSGVYSGNSDILTIDVDRRQPGRPEDLRINIEVPVI